MPHLESTAKLNEKIPTGLNFGESFLNMQWFLRDTTIGSAQNKVIWIGSKNSLQSMNTIKMIYQGRGGIW